MQEDLRTALRELLREALIRATDTLHPPAIVTTPVFAAPLATLALPASPASTLAPTGSARVATPVFAAPLTALPASPASTIAPAGSARVATTVFAAPLTALAAPPASTLAPAGSARVATTVVTAPPTSLALAAPTTTLAPAGSVAAALATTLLAAADAAASAPMHPRLSHLHLRRRRARPGARWQLCRRDWTDGAPLARDGRLWHHGRLVLPRRGRRLLRMPRHLAHRAHWAAPSRARGSLYSLGVRGLGVRGRCSRRCHPMGVAYGRIPTP